MKKMIEIFLLLLDSETSAGLITKVFQYMENLHLKIIVPSLILALKVIVKFTVGRRPENRNYKELFFELPTDIIFLSVSFSLVYVFLNNPIQRESVIIFIVFLILAILVVFLFRISREILDSDVTKKNILILILIVPLNYYVSVSGLYFSSEQILKENCIDQTKENKVSTKTGSPSEKTFKAESDTKSEPIKEPQKEDKCK